MIELDVDDKKPSKRYFLKTKSPGVVNVKLTRTRMRTQDDLSVILYLLYIYFLFDNVNSLVFYTFLLVMNIMF